jgi:hypothetical protein
LIWLKSVLNLEEQTVVLPKLNTMKKFILSLFVQLICVAAMAQSDYGALTMTIIEKGNNLPIPFANVVVKDSNGKLVTGAQTDFDGKVDIRPIPKGVYTVEVLYLGFKKVTIEGVKISSNQSTTLKGVELSSSQFENIVCSGTVSKIELEQEPIINVRSCRGDVYYYIDEMRVRGSSDAPSLDNAGQEVKPSGLSAAKAYSVPQNKDDWGKQFFDVF